MNNNQSENPLGDREREALIRMLDDCDAKAPLLLGLLQRRYGDGQFNPWLLDVMGQLDHRQATYLAQILLVNDNFTFTRFVNKLAKAA